MLTFTEMIDWHPIVSSPLIFKYKYKFANRKFFDIAEKANRYMIRNKVQ